MAENYSVEQLNNLLRVVKGAIENGLLGPAKKAQTLSEAANIVKSEDSQLASVCEEAAATGARLEEKYNDIMNKATTSFVRFIEETLYNERGTVLDVNNYVERLNNINNELNSIDF